MRQLFNKTTFKNFLTLMSGSFFAQVFTLALYPLLTHLYLPEEFGIYGLYSAILIAVATLANGGYNNTILLPKKDSDAYHLLVLCGIFVVGISFLSLVIVLIFKNILLGMLKDKGSEWIYLLPISILLEGFYFSFSAILNREGNYKALTRAKILQALLSGGVSILIGYWLSGGLSGLIVGMIFGQFVSILSMIIEIIKSFPLKEVQWARIKQLSQEYKDFPRFELASGYLNALSRQIPFFIIPFYYNAEVLGHFTLAHKILTAPITFIGASVSQLYFQKAAKAKHESPGKINTINYKITLGFGGLSIVPVLLIVIFGPEIFELIFGEDYTTSGYYARWLAPWVAMMYILNPLSFLIDIFGKLKFHFIYNILLFISRVIISLVGGVFFSAEITIALFGISGFLFSLTLLIYLLGLDKVVKMK